MRGATLAPLAAAAVAAAGCGGVTIAAQRERVEAPRGEVPAAAIVHLRLDEAKLERRATFDSPRGRRSVFVGRKKDGMSCVLDVDADNVGAGCDPVLFGEHELALVEAFEGGPAPVTVTELHLAGVASPRVRSLRLELSDGSVADVALTARDAFLYEASLSDLRRGVVPQALHAFNAGGRRIDTMPLGGPPTA